MKKNKEAKKQEVKNDELLKAQLARALADYDNLRKRVEQEKTVIFTFAAKRIIEKLLPIIDMLENALVHIKDQGLAIAINEIKNILKEEGIREIAPKENDNFDESKMEAVEVSETNDKNLEGKIHKVSLKGYEYIDSNFVIRHAKVVVYKAKEK